MIGSIWSYEDAWTDSLTQLVNVDVMLILDGHGSLYLEVIE